MISDTIHIAIDTETWGKRAGCDARSIGACLMDISTGQIGNHHPLVKAGRGVEGEFYIACENKLQGTYSTDHLSPRALDMMDYRSGAHRKYHLWRDPGTVNWWYDQHDKDPSTLDAFKDPVDLREALISLTIWLRSIGVDPRDEKSACLWSHGAAYDPPVIEAWFHAADLPVPWHYRSARDSRTAFDMGNVGDHSEWMERCRDGIKHHALDDATTLGVAVCGAWENVLGERSLAADWTPR